MLLVMGKRAGASAARANCRTREEKQQSRRRRCFRTLCAQAQDDSHMSAGAVLRHAPYACHPTSDASSRMLAPLRERKHTNAKRPTAACAPAAARRLLGCAIPTTASTRGVPPPHRRAIPN